MDRNTEYLKGRTAGACERMGGKLWPNELGFDARGWAYRMRADQTWEAVRGETPHRALKVGEGPSPDEARNNALRPPPARTVAQLLEKADTAVTAALKQSEPLTNEERTFLVEQVQEHFRTWGGIVPSGSNNPIVNVMAGKPAEFAAGVDIAQVVDFLDQTITAVRVSRTHPKVNIVTKVVYIPNTPR